MVSLDSPPSEIEIKNIALLEPVKTFEILTEEKIEFLKKMFYTGTPIITIILSELLIFEGRLEEAVIAYTLLLLILSFSITVIKKPEVREIHQAFLLLPIFRLVNLSMPIFSEINLYSFVFIYAPLTIPLVIAISYQKTTFGKKEYISKKILSQVPLAILTGLVFGEAGYMVIGNRSLIQDLSPANVLLFIIIMIFIVGLIEEFIFRAILQKRLEKLLGSTGGILLASLLFGIMHSGYGTPFEMVFAFFVGGFLGYCFHRTKSLPFVIMINGLINIFLFGIIPNLGPGLGLM
jgi:membrane protease YdiL (CAAX protease family)